MNRPLVLDPASGGRMFYFNKNDPRVLFGDIRVMPPTELVDGRTFAVEPDQVMDFTDLPFDDNTFNLVVFDPPHCIGAGGTGWLAKKYGVLDKTRWREDLTLGFAECFRVLAPGGTLIFKWAEDSIALRDILSCTPIAPLFGNRQPKKLGTHWIVWVKVGDRDA